MSPYEALYGSRCKCPVGWFEVGKVTLIGLYLVLYAMDKGQLIRYRLKTTQCSHKS